MNRRPRLLTRALAVLAAGVLLLSGCAVTAPAPAPTQSAPAPTGLERFYEQQVDWSKCEGGLKCAQIQVPMDYSNPTGETISLALAKLEGRKANKTLLVNPGGPGASGVDLVRDAETYYFSKELRDNYDVLGFDPRGVSRSTPVICQSDAQQDAERQLNLPTDTDADLKKLRELSAASAKECAQRTGKPLGFVDTVSAVRDMDVIRALVGDPQLNYLGFSYGTKLGAAYAGLFPDQVGRLVLDGAMDPALSEEELVLGQATGFERATRAYMQNCLASGDCPFSGDLDTGMSQLHELIDSVARKPMRASDGRLLPVTAFVSGFIYPLYDDRLWPELSFALSDAIAGEADSMMELSDTAAGRNEDGSYDGNSNAAFSAINCLDYKMVNDIPTMRADAAVLEQASPTIGKYMAYGGIGCQDWPYPPTGKQAPASSTTEAPIVVIGTTGDPATPYEWAVSLSDQLQTGVMVSFEGQGHTAYARSNKCITKAVDDFLLDGKAPADGLKC